MQFPLTMISQLLDWEVQNGFLSSMTTMAKHLRMGISKITTRNRHVSSYNSTKHDGEIGYNFIIEIYSHADTLFFGKNFWIFSSIEQVCSVNASLNKLETTNNVVIVTAATAMIDDDGAVFITVFGQGIDFTEKIERGLINPNKCRSFGVQFFDNPTDTTRGLVFYSNNVFLPLHMQRTNCLADFFCPSIDKLRQFPWVFMSDELNWDPSNVPYPTISPMSQ